MGIEKLSHLEAKFRQIFSITVHPCKALDRSLSASKIGAKRDLGGSDGATIVCTLKIISHWNQRLDVPNDGV